MTINNFPTNRVSVNQQMLSFAILAQNPGAVGAFSAKTKTDVLSKEQFNTKRNAQRNQGQSRNSLGENRGSSRSFNGSKYDDQHPKVSQNPKGRDESQFPKLTKEIKKDSSVKSKQKEVEASVGTLGSVPVPIAFEVQTSSSNSNYTGQNSLQVTKAELNSDNRPNSKNLGTSRRREIKELAQQGLRDWKEGYYEDDFEDDQGDQGHEDDQGDQGHKGYQGDQGHEGYQGDQGHEGDQLRQAGPTCTTLDNRYAINGVGTLTVRASNVGLNYLIGDSPIIKTFYNRENADLKSSSEFDEYKYENFIHSFKFKNLNFQISFAGSKPTITVQSGEELVCTNIIPVTTTQSKTNQTSTFPASSTPVDKGSSSVAFSTTMTDSSTQRGVGSSFASSSETVKAQTSEASSTPIDIGSSSFPSPTQTGVGSTSVAFSTPMPTRPTSASSTQRGVGSSFASSSETVKAQTSEAFSTQTGVGSSSAFSNTMTDSSTQTFEGSTSEEFSTQRGERSTSASSTQTAEGSTPMPSIPVDNRPESNDSSTQTFGQTSRLANATSIYSETIAPFNTTVRGKTSSSQPEGNGQTSSSQPEGATYTLGAPQSSSTAKYGSTSMAVSSAQPSKTTYEDHPTSSSPDRRAPDQSSSTAKYGPSTTKVDSTTQTDPLTDPQKDPETSREPDQTSASSPAGGDSHTLTNSDNFEFKTSSGSTNVTKVSDNCYILTITENEVEKDIKINCGITNVEVYNSFIEYMKEKESGATIEDFFTSKFSYKDQGGVCTISTDNQIRIDSKKITIEDLEKNLLSLNKSNPDNLLCQNFTSALLDSVDEQKKSNQTPLDDGNLAAIIVTPTAVLAMLIGFVYYRNRQKPGENPVGAQAEMVNYQRDQEPDQVVAI